MKKVLFAIAAMAACMSANAQLWISGGASVSNDSEWNDDKSATQWNITPAIGYALDDALEVGLELNLEGYKKDETSRFNFKISPFARYTFFTDGDFSMFLQGNIDFANYSQKSPDRKGQVFGVSIKPGVKYALTDNFAMVATVGKLYWTHEDRTEYYYNDQNSFGVGVGSNLSFSLVYSF